MMGKALRLMTRIMATLMAVALFLLNGHEIVSAALQNVAALRLLAPWQEALVDPSSLLVCQLRVNDPAVDALIETALRLRPESASTWLLNGRNAWLAGKCSEAREAWRRAVVLASQNRIAWLLYLLNGPKDLQPEPAVAEGLASYFDFQGDRARSAEKWEEALEWYEKSFSLVPDVSTANRLESVYLKLERKGEAIACWEELAESLPETDPEHWWALGRAAELREDWEEAARAYGHGAELSPKPYDYWMRQGANYERLKEWERAEGAYRKAVKARPDIPWPYLSVGHMRRVQKDYNGMLEWYRKAEAVAPNRYEPQYWLGYAHYIREEYVEAQKRLERALELNPQHAWSAYYLAWSFYKQGRRGEAVSWLQQAIVLYRGQPWQWAIQLGDWLAEAGDKDGALATYRQALEWKPGDEGIAAKIKALEK